MASVPTLPHTMEKNSKTCFKQGAGEEGGARGEDEVAMVLLS